MDALKIKPENFDEIIIVAKNDWKSVFDYEKETIYTESELDVMKGIGRDEVKFIHSIKKAFNAKIEARKE